MLAARGILYVPDYLANAGGVIDFHQERIDDSRAAVLAAVGRIEAITAEVLATAARTGRTPQAVADQKVQARLEAEPARPDAGLRSRAAVGGRSPKIIPDSPAADDPLAVLRGERLAPVWLSR